MTILTVVSWSLSLAALGLSTFAVIAVHRSRATSQLRKLSEHSLMLEDLSHQLRNLRARLNMQAYRARRAGRSDDSTDDNAGAEAQSPKSWKEQMNIKLAMARLPK